MTAYLIGADLGTSALKAVLVHPRQGVLAVAECAYPMYHPRPGWSENDPEDWYRSLIEAVRLLVRDAQVDPAEVGALCLVGQRDPAVLLDASGAVVTPSIHWSDRRDPGETEELFDRVGRERIAEVSGFPPAYGLVLPNLAWTRRHLPGAWRRVRHAVPPKDYLAYRLTGEIATDLTSPSRSLLNDWRTGDWSEELCRAAGLDPGMFAPVRYRPWEARGALTSEAAAILGLAPGTILAAGGGDDQAATLACGVIEPGAVSISTASTMSWRVVVDEPSPDPAREMCLVAHVVGDEYLYELAGLGTGIPLKWFRDAFAGISDATGTTRSYQELIDEASGVSAGAEGLMFFPYVMTASLPHPNPNASGVFFGVRLGHERRHFVRAILEAAAYLYPGFAEIIHRPGREVRSITMVDGESRSWSGIRSRPMCWVAASGRHAQPRAGRSARRSSPVRPTVCTPRRPKE